MDDELLQMASADNALRTRLVEEGVLFDGYHPEMEALHIANAQRLEAMIDELGGWPDASRVGEQAAEAAWLIAQHAISLPDFQRRVLVLLQKADVPPWQAAYLRDRICSFEGRKQRYGTQFDWDENGELSPVPEIKDLDRVDERRASVGLSSLAEAIEKMRARGEQRPSDLEARNRLRDAWLVRVGWR